jgi:hypothetical protein
MLSQKVMQILAICLSMIAMTTAFSIPRHPSTLVGRLSLPCRSEENSENVAPPTLEDKMKSWEATDEEMKAASLGGLTPGVLDGRCMWIKQLSSSYFPVPNSLIMSSRF